MWLPRRAAILLSASAFFLIVLLLSHNYDQARTRLSFAEASQAIAQRIGLGDLQWSRLQNEYPDDEQESVLDNAFALPQFEYGKGKPQGYNYTKVLVIPRIKKENVSWIYEELNDVEKFVYVADDSNAPLHPPSNKGHEVMVYLTYLIDNYDILPDVIIFMHAHRHTWHNADLLNLDAVEMVRRLNPARVAREGYMNMRCSWYPGCPEWMHPGETEWDPYRTEQVLIAEAWSEIFPFEPIPKVLAQPCCSQFALSRELVRTIPKDRFEAWRNWLLRTRLRDSASGRVWEYMWQFAFTGKSVLCPAEHQCYCDGFGVCFGGQHNYEAFYAIRDERDKYAKELFAWQDQAMAIYNATIAGLPTDGLAVPESGHNETLVVQIGALQDELNKRLTLAIWRGENPKSRAEEMGREWHQGDGF